MKKYLLYLLLCVLYTPVLAQSNTCVENIKLSEATICVGSTISVEPCTGNTQADYNFGEDINDTVNTFNSRTYKYTKAGIFTIKQFVNPPLTDPGAEGITTYRQIYVLDPVAPIVRIESCQDKKVRINVLDHETPEKFTISHFSGRKDTIYYDKYIVDFGDGSTPVTKSRSDFPLLYTYTNEATYSITVKGIYPNTTDCGGTTEPESVTTFTHIKTPTIRFLTVLNKNSTEGSIKLEFESQPDLSYQIFQRTDIVNNNVVTAGTYQLLSTLTNQQGPLTDTTIGSLNTLNNNNSYNTYCYKIRVTDGCGNILESGEVCSIIITKAEPQKANNLIQVAWSDYPGTSIISYGVYRKDNKTETDFGIINSDPVAIEMYPDKTIECGVLYTYKIETSVNNGESFSISNEESAEGQLTTDPPAIEGFYSTIENEKAVLRWKLPLTGIQNITIIKNGIALTNFAGTISEYVDEEAVKNNTHCYQIIYLDKCDNESDTSITTCPVILKGESVSIKETRLNWSEYRSWEESPSYIIELLDEKGNIFKEIDAGYTLSNTDTDKYNEHQKVRYRIKVVPPVDSLPLSYSNIFEVVQPVRLFFPTAFSPNGDLNNDTFRGIGVYIGEYELNIFNRWGEIVYHTTSFEDSWDGTYNGKPAPAGSYVYQVEAKDQIGKTLQQKGNITLIR